MNDIGDGMVCCSMLYCSLVQRSRNDEIIVKSGGVEPGVTITTAMVSIMQPDALEYIMMRQ